MNGYERTQQKGCSFTPSELHIFLLFCLLMMTIATKRNLQAQYPSFPISKQKLMLHKLKISA
jgi:hypothetical protein